MALNIVTGGTTGAADGTLVSSGNKIVFSALDAVVDCHIRADADTYSADTSFSPPSDGAVQVSFDGGSTWKAFVTNPNAYGADIGDLNVAIKLRQHALASSSTGLLQTDGTTPAATALTPNPVASFTATPGNTTVALSWTAVTNRTAYRIDRATDSGFTTGVALDISPGLTSTTLTDTGRTNGTAYYYRIKAVGTGRYSDTVSYATANATPAVPNFLTDTFTGSGLVTGHTGETGATWTAHPNFAGSGSKIVNNRAYQDSATDQVLYASGTPASADYSVSIVVRRIDASGSTNRSRAALGRMSTSASTMYVLDIADDPTVSGNGSAPFLRLAKFVGGTFTQLGYYNVTLTQGVDYTLRLEMIGTSIKGYLDGTLRISATDSAITAAGKAGYWQFNSASAETSSAGIHIDSIIAG